MSGASSDNMSSPSDTKVPLAPHPEELSRKISEIDLTSIRARPRDTLPEHGRTYSHEELLNLRPETQDGRCGTSDFMFGGVKTPPSPPHNTPPNNTPRDITPACIPGADGAGEEKKKKKKKKKNSPGCGKNKAGITGFEEFYADPPMTPDEHEEECDLYSQSRPLPDRIQTCIQRFRHRRKLGETHNLIMTKYWSLGGIDSVTSKNFTGGLDRETIENSTAEEIAAIKATDFIRSGGQHARFYDPLNPEGWAVDFEGVVKGFLSHTATQHIGCTNKQISTYCAVVKNFLNYILTHAVCPEYTENVLAARNLCDLAEKELTAINHLRSVLPGEFNVAASTMYGGRYQGILLTNRQWGTIDPLAKEYLSVNQSMEESEAQRIFKTAIALSGTEEMFTNVMKEEVEIVATKKAFFEVASIEQPPKETVDQCGTVKNDRGDIGYIKPLGLLKVKAWEGPGIEEEDMTDDEDNEVAQTPSDTQIEQFWLENDILDHCFIGLKLETTVHELNIGIKFFDHVAGLYCAFYTFLPNEKMNGWKEPNLSTRAPPTEDDLDAEEAAMMGEMERDVAEDEKIGEKLASQTTLDMPC